MTLLKKKINKISNKKLTLWEEILCIILIIFVFIGFIYTTIFCLNLIVDTYDYVTNIPTRDDVTYMIERNNYNLLRTLKVEELKNSKGVCKITDDSYISCLGASNN